ncbi:hypothetical protein LTR49_022523 [Elasticomyces elasticus]|nr:hypothetical protein LTR49_022523 [Elasticomyces elasticus]
MVARTFIYTVRAYRRPHPLRQLTHVWANAVEKASEVSSHLGGRYIRVGTIIQRFTDGKQSEVELVYAAVSHAFGTDSTVLTTYGDIEAGKGMISRSNSSPDVSFGSMYTIEFLPRYKHYEYTSDEHIWLQIELDWKDTFQTERGEERTHVAYEEEDLTYGGRAESRY